MATVAFYGPDDKLATKVVVAVFSRAGGKVERMEKWYSRVSDVREDELIRQEIVAFVKNHHVAHAITTEGIIGCPHEEGIDYPVGEFCPLCLFWKGRNRFTGQQT
jgi:hypothetical protein